MELLFLNRQDIEKLLTVETAFEANEEAYKAHSGGNCLQPPIVSMEFAAANGEMDIKSGYSGLNKTVGVKVLSGFWDNPEKHDLPISMGLMTLYDGETGRPLCVMDAGMITYYRTAAAGAFAATLLARRNSRSLAVIGTGGLGRMHLIATEKYFDLQNVYVYSIDAAQQQAFVQEFSQKYPAIRFHSCHTAQEAVENADIISTATPAQKAVVLSAWVKPGTHINAFGCDMTGKQEIDPALFARAKLVVDNAPECVKRGEAQHVDASLIHAEIGQIALGLKPGRESDDEITVFDSTGMSLQDISTAFRIYKKALALHVGTKVTM